MTRYALSLLAVLSFGRFAAAEELDADALRKCSLMPTLGWNFRLNTGDPRGLDEHGNRIDAAKKLDGLERRLTGGLGDAWTLYQIILTYFDLEDSRRARETWVRLENLLRPALDRKDDPAEGWMLGLYASALVELEPRKLDKAKRWAERAVKLAPADWRSWFFLGIQRESEVMAKLASEVAARKPGLTPLECWKHLEGSAAPSEATIVAAEKLLADARAQFDKALEIAPHDPEQLAGRLNYLSGERFYRNLFRTFRGAPAVSDIGDANLAAELRRLARLRPDHIGLQGGALMASCCAALADTKGAKAASPSSGIAWASTDYGGPVRVATEKGTGLDRRLGPDAVKEVKDFVANLNRLADGPSIDAARNTLPMLCWYHFVCEDFKGMERQARRLVKRDPQSADGIILVARALESQDRFADAADVLRPLVKARPTARHFLFLGHALLWAERLGDAENALRAGLKAEPDDVSCLIALAAVLIRRDGKTETLAEAAKLLDRAAVELRPDCAKDQTFAVEFNQALCRCLSGNTFLGRLRLERLRQEHPSDDYVRKALAAFGQ